MIRARLDGYYIDASGARDPDAWEPDDANDFRYSLGLFISGDDGNQATFYLNVCTPRWLEQHGSDIVSGRHTVIVQRHDIDELIKYVEEHISRVSADTWEWVMRKMDYLAQDADEWPDDPGHHVAW
jgi:hypothetical protein